MRVENYTVQCERDGVDLVTELVAKLARKEYYKLKTVLRVGWSWRYESYSNLGFYLRSFPLRPRRERDETKLLIELMKLEQ